MRHWVYMRVRVWGQGRGRISRRSGLERGFMPVSMRRLQKGTLTGHVPLMVVVMVAAVCHNKRGVRVKT